MAYDEGLEERLRDGALRDIPHASKRMFGGIAFMVGGHMAVGIVGDRLMVRIDPQAQDEVLAMPHVHPMDFTGRPMRGFVFVDAEGIADDPELASWVDRGVAYARSLPSKR